MRLTIPVLRRRATTVQRMRIGILGSGSVGQTLGRGFAASIEQLSGWQSLRSRDTAEAAMRSRWLRDLREEYSRELAYLGHAAALKDDLTPGENLRIAASLSGVDTSSGGIREALSGFQVPDLPVRKLSQGQKRRAALARLVASAQVPLWLLDEPFSALDAAGIELLKGLINGHVERGNIVVYTTHQDPGLLAARVLELS